MRRPSAGRAACDRRTCRKSRVRLRRLALPAVLVFALCVPSTRFADAGHESPFYPSFYPQEIRVETADPAAAADALPRGTLHAYVGGDPFAAGPPPEDVGFVESLGAYVVVSFDPARPAPIGAGRSERRWVPGSREARCAAASRIAGALTPATPTGVYRPHPYPVTPFHADYLLHADLVEAAKARVRGSASAEPAAAPLRLAARGSLAESLVPAGWRARSEAAGATPDAAPGAVPGATAGAAPAAADAAVEVIDIDALLAPHRGRLNGWLGPPWLKAGWFHAYLIHASAITDRAARESADVLFRRLVTGAGGSAVERANLERRLVATLTRGCERVVVGYTVRREAFSTAYSGGIENVGYDAHAGLGSAIFVRTAKLKDFPWNGWLKVGTAGQPAAAWNPIGGFTDPAGGFIWSAVGDPALFPEPYGDGWVPNRVAAVAGDGVAPAAAARAGGAAAAGAQGASPGTAGSGAGGPGAFPAAAAPGPGAAAPGTGEARGATGAGTAAGPASAGRGAVLVPPDALLPEPGTGQLKPVGGGKRAGAKVVYRVLASLFHDGTRTTAADLLYAYALAFRWGAAPPGSADPGDPYVAAATAPLREWLAGVRPVGVEEEVRDLGDARLTYEVPVIEVYLVHPAADPGEVAAVAPPWSTVPWHLAALAEEAVGRGLAAFSAAEAARRGVPWLDLARDRRLKAELAALIDRYAREGHVPPALARLVTPGEARERWAALRRFYRQHGHFLVANGPYLLDKWSPDGAVLQVFRDLTYPLGVGTFDRYALPRRAFLAKAELKGDRLEITADAERVFRFQRSYELIREPFGSGPRDEAVRDTLVCRYVVVGPDREVVEIGTAAGPDGPRFSIDLRRTAARDRRAVAVGLYLNGNAVNPAVAVIPLFRDRPS